VESGARPHDTYATGPNALLAVSVQHVAPSGGSGAVVIGVGACLTQLPPFSGALLSVKAV
jgi:hypothetical protein